MLGSVGAKTLRDYRRSLVWWGLGVVGFVALYAAIYPTVRDLPDIDDLLDSYPEALRAFIGASGDLDLSTPEGYLKTEAFSFLLPLLFLIFGIGAGAAAIAGEEEHGTMELLLAQPLSRRRLDSPPGAEERDGDWAGFGYPRAAPAPRPGRKAAA